MSRPQPPPANVARLRCTRCQRQIEFSAAAFLLGTGQINCPCVLAECCNQWFPDDLAWFLHLPDCPGITGNANPDAGDGS